MAIAEKSNGDIRICIGPQALNNALMREHYKLPTFHLVEMKDARVFRKLDIKEAYWHVRLDYELSLMITMITPFGRFSWARFPWGLKVSSEIFQKNLGGLCKASKIPFLSRMALSSLCVVRLTKNPI